VLLRFGGGPSDTLDPQGNRTLLIDFDNKRTVHAQGRLLKKNR
jgi:hypothetical protein